MESNLNAGDQAKIAKDIHELHRTIMEASLNFDIWAAYKDDDLRCRYTDTMNRYHDFFRTGIQAHFVAMLIALYRLYENKRTHNIPKLLERMADQLSPEARLHLRAMEAQAMPIWVDVGILRNRVFGHRSNAHTPEELFKMAKMTTDRFKQLCELSKTIVSDLTYVWDRSRPDFSTTAREDMISVLDHLQARRTD